MNWSDYQEKVADHFRKMGASAQTNVPVQGARGVHMIDVDVKFKWYGQIISWIIECKFWKTAIPKEKILTLYQIVQDIGADRGFLFCEKGFQAGAIKAATNTNIKLTSLSEIEEISQGDLYESYLIQTIKKINALKTSIHYVWIDDLHAPAAFGGIVFDEVVYLDGTLLFLSLKIQNALNKEFPVILGTYSRGTIHCINHEQLIENMNVELNLLETEIKKILEITEQTITNIFNNKKNFIESVQKLLRAGESALFPKNGDSAEQFRLAALKEMREVGKYADELKEISRGSIKRELGNMMRLLIDTVYLFLTYETIEQKIWDNTKNQVARQIKSMEDLIIP